MLEIENLSKHYGDVKAVQDLDLTIEPGEIFCMLGANGAGKATTLMVALGFTEPTAGTIRICGVDVTHDPLEAKRHVAYVSENSCSTATSQRGRTWIFSPSWAKKRTPQTQTTRRCWGEWDYKRMRLTGE